MVLVVFLVGVALISAFLVAITGASKVTMTSRDTVRAQAAAEAGIADVLGRMADPDTTICSLASTTFSDPGGVVDYGATVSFGAVNSTEVPASWSSTCPIEPTLVRILSTGEAGGSTQTIERIHVLDAPPAVAQGYNDIIYSDGSWTFSGNTDLSTVDPARPADVVIREGDFTCTAGATVHGSVYVKNGNASLSGNCKIAGSLEVAGNLTRSGSAQVYGDAIIDGDVTLSGGTLPVIGGVLNHRGSLTLNSGITKASGIGGTVNQTPVTIAPPEPWRSLSLQDFVDAGFEKVTWTGSCSIAYYNNPVPPMLAVLQGLTKPTVIDATACSTLSIVTDITIKLGSDVAIVAPKAVLTAFTFASTNADKHNLYVVSSNTSASCPSSRTDLEVSGVKFTDGKISGLLYAECRVVMNNWGPLWQGSIYSRNISSIPLVKFSPVGDPDEIGGGDGGDDSTPGELELNPTPVLVRNVTL